MTFVPLNYRCSFITISMMMAALTISILLLSSAYSGTMDTLYLSADVKISFRAPAHFLLMVPIRLPLLSGIKKFQAFQSTVIRPISVSVTLKIRNVGWKNLNYCLMYPVTIPWGSVIVTFDIQKVQPHLIVTRIFSCESIKSR